MGLINSHSEILFLYDIKDANPNGDPVDENKPRIDEETGINIVTDVRLKRTIRDYLFEYKGQEVFIREIRDEKGNLRTKEDRLLQFKDEKDIIKNCIDVRLFGATTAVKDKTMTLTGPVQFKFGRSLHKVDLTYIKGTTIMPSKEDKKQGTFTEKYILPYSLIAFYGIVNQNAAKMQNIDLTEEDVKLMLEGIWEGTKALISTSKFGQMPRLLLHVVYKKENFFIGELDRRIKFISPKRDEEIRDITDGKIELAELLAILNKYKENVDKIEYKADERVRFTVDGEETTLIEVLKDFKLEELHF